MLNRLRANGGIGMREAAELVGKAVLGPVLESIRIDRIEPQSQCVGMSLQSLGVGRFVPGKMQRNSGRRARKAVNDRAIVNLVENVGRFTRAGKAREARSSRTDAPGWQGHREARDCI